MPSLLVIGQQIKEKQSRAPNGEGEAEDVFSLSNVLDHDETRGTSDSYELMGKPESNFLFTT